MRSGELHCATRGYVVPELDVRGARRNPRAGRIGQCLGANVLAEVLRVVWVVRGHGGGDGESIHELVDCSGGTVQISV